MNKIGNLTSEQIQDYLLNLQSKVFTNNDVYTVKEKKIWPMLKNEEKSSIDKTFIFEDNIQSDQPNNNTNYHHHNQQLSNFRSSTTPGETSSKKPMMSTLKSQQRKASTVRDDFVQDDQYQSVDSQRMWNCEFKNNHSCGIVNDHSVGEYFHLENRNFFRSFNWNSWYLMLNATTMPKGSAGARLITPYLATKNTSQGVVIIIDFSFFLIKN